MFHVQLQAMVQNVASDVVRNAAKTFCHAGRDLKKLTAIAADAIRPRLARAYQLLDMKEAGCGCPKVDLAQSGNFQQSRPDQNKLRQDVAERSRQPICSSQPDIHSRQISQSGATPSSVTSLLTAEGFRRYEVTGEGNQCGSRASMLGLLNHYCLLDAASRATFWRGLVRNVDMTDAEKADLEGIFRRAADHGLRAVLQVGYTGSETRYRIRCPREPNTFQWGGDEGNDAGFKTQGEALFQAFFLKKIDAGLFGSPAAKRATGEDETIAIHAACDWKESLESSARYMDVDTVGIALAALGVNGVATQQNGRYWTPGPAMFVNDGDHWENDVREQAIGDRHTVVVRPDNRSHFTIYLRDTAQVAMTQQKGMKSDLVDRHAVSEPGTVVTWASHAEMPLGRFLNRLASQTVGVVAKGYRAIKRAMASSQLA
ncbi:MAG: hypothetical protein P8176_11865 [Gammaproteobacteria bacterium]